MCKSASFRNSFSSAKLKESPLICWIVSLGISSILDYFSKLKKAEKGRGNTTDNAKKKKRVTFESFLPVCVTEGGLSFRRSPLRRLCSGTRWISRTWDDQWRPGTSRRHREESAGWPCAPHQFPPYLYSCHLGTSCPICLHGTQSKSVKEILLLIQTCRGQREPAQAR